MKVKSHSMCALGAVGDWLFSLSMVSPGFICAIAHINTSFLSKAAWCFSFRVKMALGRLHLLPVRMTLL